MKLQDIEKISEYFDGESPNPEEIQSLINENQEYGNVYKNFSNISSVLNKELGIEASANKFQSNLGDFWTRLDQRIEKEDNELSSVLKKSLGDIPKEFDDLDLWKNIEGKLDDVQELGAPKPTNYEANVVRLQSQNSFDNILKAGFELPSELKDLDVWESINKKLDSQFHEEIFSENASEEWSDKEKFFVGLSEFIDGEVSAQKAQVINDHILECSDCRKLYLAFTKMQQALKFGFQVDLEQSERYTNFWNELEENLFPQENNENTTIKKAQGL